MLSDRNTKWSRKNTSNEIQNQKPNPRKTQKSLFKIYKRIPNELETKLSLSFFVQNRNENKVNYILNKNPTDAGVCVDDDFLRSWWGLAIFSANVRHRHSCARKLNTSLKSRNWD